MSQWTEQFTNYQSENREVGYIKIGKNFTEEEKIKENKNKRKIRIHTGAPPPPPVGKGGG